MIDIGKVREIAAQGKRMGGVIVEPELLLAIADELEQQGMRLASVEKRVDFVAASV